MLSCHHHHLIPERHHPPLKETPYLLVGVLSFSLLPSSVCIDLPILDISYKWNHTICDLLIGFFHLASRFQGWSILQLLLVLSFYGRIIIHCIVVLYFVCSFVIGWTFGLFPLFGYHE